MIAVLLCWHPGLVREKSYWQVAATLGLLSTFKKKEGSHPSFLLPFCPRLHLKVSIGLPNLILQKKWAGIFEGLKIKLFVSVRIVDPGLPVPVSYSFFKTPEFGFGMRRQNPGNHQLFNGFCQNVGWAG